MSELSNAAEIARENEALRARLGEVENQLAETEDQLAEAQEVIRAIQSGEVDAVVVSGAQGERIFTLKDAEYAYRALVEAMNEGAATLDADGTVLYCNQRLADLVGFPLEQVIGSSCTHLFTGEARHVFEAFLARGLCGEAVSAEFELYLPDGRCTPASVSLREMKGVEPAVLCMVVTDLTEHRKRDELIAAGNLATSILESSAEAIAVCDETGTIIMANGAMESLCGFNPLFQPFESVLALEVSLDVGESFRPFSITAAIAGTVPRTHEVRFRRKDGQTFSLLLSSGTIATAGGVFGCVLTMTDITERKRAQEALLETEERFRVAQELSPDGFTLLRPVRDDSERVIDFVFVYENAAGARLNGTDRNEIVGRRLLAVFPSHRASTFFKAYQHASETGERLTFEEEYSRGNGERPAWLRITVVPVNGDIAIQAQDLTERKRSEDALRESEARFRALFDNSPDAVFLTVPNGEILAANSTACVMFGMTEEELCRVGREALVDSSDRRVAALVEERRRTKRNIKAELTCVRANGERFPAEVDSVILSDAPNRSFVIIHDVSDRKRAEQALIQSEKLASVGRMASTIAHEINNPLETIGHALYLVATEPGIPERAKSYIDLAGQELERAAQIAKQTLAFHRENTKPTLIQLQDSVEGALKIFAPRLKAKGIAVQSRYAKVPPIIAGNGEVRQIISNLLSNSMDATPSGGRIRLQISSTLRRDSLQAVRYTIADTGCGIERDKLKKIFEPFFTTKEVVGTGLGLWVTKQIVDKLGGTIRVRSKVGLGTVISIVFPTQGSRTE